MNNLRNQRKNKFRGALIPAVMQMYWLPERFKIFRPVKKKIVVDFKRFKKCLPDDIHSFILDRYGFDISGRYGSHKTRIVFGKASGQLLMTAEQVKKGRRDVTLLLVACIMNPTTLMLNTKHKESENV